MAADAQSQVNIRCRLSRPHTSDRFQRAERTNCPMVCRSAATSTGFLTSATYQLSRPGQFLVSPRLRKEFANGHTYYALEGQLLRPHSHPDATPDRALLAWHSESVFQAT
jgi:hypothetical protein